MKTQTLTVTQDHLKKALSKPWSTCSCLLAIAIEDMTGEEVLVCGYGVAHTGLRKFMLPDSLTDLQRLFDHVHGRQLTDYLQDLESRLPLTAKVEVYDDKLEDHSE